MVLVIIVILVVVFVVLFVIIFESLVFTLCTNLFNIKNSTVYPKIVFVCLVFISQPKTIISLKALAETECVHCAVQANCLYIVQVIHSR